MINFIGEIDRLDPRLKRRCTTPSHLLFGISLNKGTMKSQEVWRDIPGYKGLYQVSNFGRIKSLKRNRIIKQQVQNGGYKLIHLYSNSKRKALTVHRLVALSFISNPQNKPHINHKDCDKSNNWLDNLEWVTPSENMQHAFKNGLCNNGEWDNKRRKILGERMSKLHKNKPKTLEHNQKNRDAHKGKIYGKRIPIRVKWLWNNEICLKDFASIRETSREMNISRTKIKKVLNSDIMINKYSFHEHYKDRL